MARHDQRNVVVLCLSCLHKDHSTCLNKLPLICRLCDCKCIKETSNVGNE